MAAETAKIRLKLGSMEIEYEGTEAFLRDDLFNLLEKAASWKPPKTSQFWRVCDSIDQVCAGGRRCAVRRDFSMLTSG